MGHDAQLPGVGPQECGEQSGPTEHHEQHGDRCDQSLAAVEQPADGIATPGAVGTHRSSVGVATDDEEQGHHLQQPRDRVGPPEDLEGVHVGQYVAVVDYHRRQPVAGHHRENRRCAQQVHVPHTLGRGGLREVA